VIVGERYCILNLAISVNKYNPLRGMLHQITVGNYDEESGNQRAIYGQFVFRVVSGSRSAFG